MTTLSTELGKRAHKLGIADCEPFKDKVFMLYLEKYDLPIVLCVTEYTKGYNDRKNKIDADAICRRSEFRVV